VNCSLTWSNVKVKCRQILHAGSSLLDNQRICALTGGRCLDIVHTFKTQRKLKNNYKEALVRVATTFSPVYVFAFLHISNIPPVVPLAVTTALHIQTAMLFYLYVIVQCFDSDQEVTAENEIGA